MIYTEIYNVKKLSLRAFRVLPPLEVAAEKRGEGELVFSFLRSRCFLLFSSLFSNVKGANGPFSYVILP